MLDRLINARDAEALSRLLKESRRIVLTCHVRPDGDAIGSTLGLWHMLHGDKEVHVVTPDAAPRSVAFLPGFSEIVAATRYPDYSSRLISEADLIVCCDFNQMSRTDALAPQLEASAAQKVLIDHHRFPEDFATLTISDPSMSSTCELMFRLMAAMGWYSSMSEQAAECILTGMITDTRNFTVNCNHPDIYEVLIALLRKGVDKQKIIREALELKSYDSVKLRAYALSEKMEIIDRGKKKGKVAIITLDSDELNRFHYERGDCEGLVNVPLEIRGVIASFQMRQDPDCIKVSARSVDGYPVGDICTLLYGGGGHLMAAGGEYHGSLQECRQILVDYLKKE